MFDPFNDGDPFGDIRDLINTNFADTAAKFASAEEAAKRVALTLARLPVGIDVLISGEGQSLLAHNSYGPADTLMNSVNPLWLDWRMNSSGVYGWNTVNPAALTITENGVSNGGNWNAGSGA